VCRPHDERDVRAAVVDLGPMPQIEDVITAVGGVLGGSAVHLASGDAEEEVIDLRAHLTGEHSVGAAAADQGAHRTVMLVVIIGVCAPKRGWRRHGRGDGGSRHILWLLLHFHWRGSSSTGRAFWRRLLEVHRPTPTENGDLIMIL
jgi:hypothetical protein